MSVTRLATILATLNHPRDYLWNISLARNPCLHYFISY